MTKTLADLVSQFGKEVTRKLNDPSVTGEPEDQLRGPLEALIAGINALIAKNPTG